MGLDALDITFRLEKRFGVQIKADDVNPFFLRPERDMTVGELYDVLCRLSRDAEKPLPDDCWNGFAEVLQIVLGVDQDEIVREAWLVRDLGMT